MATPSTSIVIRGYFGPKVQTDSREPTTPYDREFTVFGDDGKENGKILLQMGGGRDRSTVSTPWGKVSIAYDRSRSMNFEILRDGRHLADATHTTRKPVVIAYSEDRTLVFKVKPFTAKLVSKNSFGSYEIQYGQLSGESILRSAPKGEGYRRWRVAILGDTAIDKETIFTGIGAFTCHLYEMLWPDYPNTLDSINCFPIGD